MSVYINEIKSEIKLTLSINELKKNVKKKNHKRPEPANLTVSSSFSQIRSLKSFTYHFCLEEGQDPGAPTGILANERGRDAA